MSFRDGGGTLPTRTTFSRYGAPRGFLFASSARKTLYFQPSPLRSCTTCLCPPAKAEYRCVWVPHILCRFGGNAQAVTGPVRSGKERRATITPRMIPQRTRFEHIGVHQSGVGPHHVAVGPRRSANEYCSPSSRAEISKSCRCSRSCVRDFSAVGHPHPIPSHPMKSRRPLPQRHGLDAWDPRGLTSDVDDEAGAVTLNSEQATKLLVLMCHARRCSGQHSSPRLAEVTEASPL